MKLMWMLTLYVATSQAEVQPKVKILVIGRTGSGKSTLINNILGRPVAEVGNRPFPKTKTVSVYQEEIHGVHVTACDAPGLGDASRNEGDYINKMKNNCGDPDLVLFCLNMDNTRWHDDDEEAIKSVTNHLGKEMWKNSALILTFADKRVPCSEADFKERISDLETLFKATLTKVGVSSSNIPSAVSAKGCKDLPGVSNWLTELMVTCLIQIKEGGKEGLRQMILWRLKFPNEVNKDDIEKPEYERPFVFTESLCSLLKL